MRVILIGVKASKATVLHCAIVILHFKRDEMSSLDLTVYHCGVEDKRFAC